MDETRLIMGMPIHIVIGDTSSSQKDIDDIFTYFQSVDNRFSTYKTDSEISRFNRGKIREKDFSFDMRKIFRLSEKTKKETNGFFDIKKTDGTYDPSGLVKGWAIFEASKILTKKDFHNFYIDAGGDIQVSGKNLPAGRQGNIGDKWRVGIKNPFNQNEIIKIIGITTEGIATSGTYIRGQHVYNPHQRKENLTKIVSMTVIGKNVYEADRFATAAFAMQEKGIYFLERREGLEGYMIDMNGIATMTSGFEKYVC